MRRSNMRARPFKVAALVLVSAALLDGLAQARPVTRAAELTRFAEELRSRVDRGRGSRYEELVASLETPARRQNEDPRVELMYVDERDRPVYYGIENLEAARTLSADDVWPGGLGGFALTGAGTTRGELCVWDGGGVLVSHQEFGGRAVQEDNAGGTHFHSTHVAGTMIGGGVEPGARGMSFEAELSAYDWSYDESEMAQAAAAGANVSNHSYGYIVGWRWDGDWYWYGDADVSPDEDHGFGFYGQAARDWDQIAHDAPYYTIVKSAGNDRSNTGPAPGGGHWMWDGDWVWSTEVREPDGGADGYDSVAWNATAKNIITVGAVQDISSGWSAPGDVAMTSFSCWGPTDDGRIKPDLVANGVGLYSCVDASPTSYQSYSGTSMSAPNLAGSLNLLVRHYEGTHASETPLAATMKAVLIETADEAGAHDGPDYTCGWGLANTYAAAELIDLDGVEPGLIVEESLANGEVDEYLLVSEGAAPIRLTVAWTDPPGTPPEPSLDPPDLMLVHDLDVRIEHLETGTVHEPYVLDPGRPADPPARGDNARDNVEQVVIDAPAAGDYRVTVSHKGVLAGNQDYSVASLTPLVGVQTGIGDAPVKRAAFELHRNYPNPFNPSTTIRYELRSRANVRLTIHNAAGRRVRVLDPHRARQAGLHEAIWDGRDDAGRSLSSGVYYYRLDVDAESMTRGMVMLK